MQLLVQFFSFIAHHVTFVLAILTFFFYASPMSMFFLYSFVRGFNSNLARSFTLFNAIAAVDVAVAAAIVAAIVAAAILAAFPLSLVKRS